MRTPGRFDRRPLGARINERLVRIRFTPWLAALVLVLVATGSPATARAQAPGPESFAREPKTPLELWAAIDYLMRTGQAKQAVPYLEKFTKGTIDDATMTRIRDQYGPGSILRLDDDPLTRKFARPLVDRLAQATRRYAVEPERIARAVAGLSKSQEEQDFAVARLREAGPYAVPFLIQALDNPALGDRERSLVAANMGRLDQSSVPALLPALDSPDPRLAADAATALGRIGDPRAVPYLTAPAAAPNSPAALKSAAREAIQRITGQPFEAQSRTPARVLTEAAWGLHRHLVDFPGDSVILWSWDQEQKQPVAQQVSRDQAEARLGLRLTGEALRLDPQDSEAQAAQLSLTLDKAIDRVGYGNFPAKDQAAFAQAVSAGPAILGDVLRRAIADGKTDLAAAVATALGKVTDRSMLSIDGRPHPLVAAMSTPGRRLQFAAARAVVGMDPSLPFPGSSRVVPTLARFVTNEGPPRAVVIDGNPARGSKMAGLLKTLGYEPELELRGDRGFTAASESADVELILISNDLFQGAWGLTDTLANLRSDGRTANVATYVYGPGDLDTRRPGLLANFPGVKFLVQAQDAPTLERFLGDRPARLTDAERTAYAREAAALLARIASQPNSPLAADLSGAEPALAIALRLPGTGASASAALGDVPNPDAQRSLADVVLDPSRPVDLRGTSAAQLARSIQRFGPLVSADQEARLAASFNEEGDPSFKSSLAAVIGSLRARSDRGRGKRSATPAASGAAPVLILPGGSPIIAPPAAAPVPTTLAPTPNPRP